jgi:UPF0716 protein FxsA
MFAKLLLLFIAVPIIELALLVKLGTLVGFWPTLALVLVTGTLGALLTRSQGLRVVRQIQAEMAVGQMPAASLIDGLLVLIGGVVLLTPGLLTDIAGLVLLMPPTRDRIRAILRRKMEGMIRSGTVRVFTPVR